MQDMKENVTPNFLKINSCINPTTGKTLEFVNKRPCVIAAVIANGKILMVNQYRCGCDSKIDEFVAGIIEENQTPEEALKAELRQEAGIEEKDIKEIAFINKLYSSVGWTNELAYTYIVELNDTFVQQEQQLDKDENLTYKWLEINDVINMLSAQEKIFPIKTAYLISVLVNSMLNGQNAYFREYIENTLKEKRECKECQNKQ